jgi:glycosyltransferase involved in cell wall biosynthesis
VVQNKFNSSGEVSVKENLSRIVHVTESLGGGVLFLLHQLIKAQISSGCDVTLVHSIRSDTPSSDILDKLFPPPTLRIILPMVTNISLKSDLTSFRNLSKLFKAIQPDIIHLHSSKAGALGRAAAKYVGMGNKVYYSPHGFSFLRCDISFFKRKIFFLMEMLGGLICGRLIASSASEAELAETLVGRRRVYLVENCTDISEAPNAKIPSMKPVRIMSAGRLCYQKGPWRFWDLAASLKTEFANFVWVGDGEMREEIKRRDSSGDVLIAGWVDRDRLWQEMLLSDIFIMTSLWEGMPLTLIDAQALGLPAIVPDVVGCRDVVIDGITGYVCKTDCDLLEKTRELIHDVRLRMRMGEAARNMCLKRFSVQRMNNEMMKIYGFPH